MHLQSSLERRDGPHSESGKTSPRNLQSTLFGKQQKAARSSHELDKSLLSRLQTSKVEHEGLPFWKVPRNHSQGKQHIHFLKNEVKEKEFLAYVIVSKQSNSGVSEHERFVLVDSFSKEVRYYSKIPSFPLILTQLPEQPKETLKMILAKKFSIVVSKNNIGEVDIKWIQGGEQKKWVFRLANSNLARQFATLIERVRLNEYLRQDIKGEGRAIDYPVSPKATNFIEDIRKLQIKSNSKQFSDSHFRKNQESSQIDNAISITAAIQEVSAQQSPLRRQKSKNNQENEVVKSIKEIPLEIIPTSSKEETQQYSLDQPKPNSDSIKSIKMQTILKEVYQIGANQAYKAKKQANEEVPKEVITTNSRLSNSRVSNQTFNESLELYVQSKSKRQKIFQPPLSPKPQQIETSLALSKILVTKLDNSNPKSITKPLNEGSLSKKKIFQTPNKHYYKTQQPQILEKLRDNLLEQRRVTQPAEASHNSSKRSSFIVNLHSQPRREKSNSKSRQKSIGQFQTAQRQWLLKWVNTSSIEERAELYAQFVESCRKRVEKLAESFLNWHLFHKEVSEYIIKQNNVEYRYYMLSKEGNGSIDVLSQEEEMLNKMEDLNELWAMLNQLPQSVARIIIPLACIVIYKGLKVYCKAELFSNSLIISQLKERSSFKDEIQAVKAHFKGCLSYASFFLISSNTNRWLYISDIQISSSIGNRGTFSLSYAFIHDYFNTFNSFSIEKAEEHLRKQSIISYLEELNSSTLLSSSDFSRILKKHLLNPTLLPLIYQKAEEKQLWKARKWMISQLCSIFLEKEARCLMHAFLLKKKINKSVEEQIYSIISKLLRWQNEGSSIISQVSRFLGVNLNFKLADIVIDQYVISSLLNRLRIGCKLLLPENIVRVDQRDPLFWRNVQFQADFMQISFGMATKGLEHSLFSQNYRKINQYLSFEEILTSASEYSYFYSLLGEKRVPSKQSRLYKLLPWEKQAKIEQYERIFAGEAVNSTSQYYGLEQLKLNLAHLIKSKQNYHGKANYQKWENSILVEIIRANIWARQASAEIMLLHSLLSEQYYSCREETKCIQESLSLLKLSLAYKEEGLISIEQLLEITISTGNIHMTFGRLENAFNFFKVSQSILDEILKNTRKMVTFLFPFFSCYCKCADIFLEGGRYEQCLGEIAYVRKVCDSWKQCIPMKLQEYEPIKQVTFHICSVLFRTYEILCKRMQLLQVVEDSSRQFIQNYFVIQAENNLAFDHSYIKLETAVQIVRQIWKAIILNLTPKNVSYQYYFSKTYSLLKVIDASVVGGIIKVIQSQTHQLDPYSKEEAVKLICTLIYNKTPKSMLQKLSSKCTESILVEECISCLAHLSSERFMQPQNEQQEGRNRQALKFLSILLSLMGFSFAIASLEQHLKEEEH